MYIPHQAKRSNKETVGRTLNLENPECAICVQIVTINPLSIPAVDVGKGKSAIIGMRMVPQNNV